MNAQNIATIARLVPTMEIVPAVRRDVLWDEPVFTGPLLSPRGQVIPGRAGVFTSDGIYLGDYAGEGSILPNAMLAQMVEDALGQMGLEFNRQTHVSHGGAVLRIRYEIPSIQISSPDGKNGNSLVIQIDNSYNGLKKISATIQALRLICLNAALGISSALDLNKRHTAKMDVPNIIGQLRAGIENEAKTLADTFGAMGRVELPGDQPLYVIRHLTSNNGHGGKNSWFGNRLAQQVETVWQAGPKGLEANAKGTLWGLFNAGTEVLSARERGEGRETGKGGFERASHQLMLWGEFCKALATPGYKFKLGEGPKSLKDFTRKVEFDATYGDAIEA